MVDQIRIIAYKENACSHHRDLLYLPIPRDPGRLVSWRDEQPGLESFDEHRRNMGGSMPRRLKANWSKLLTGEELISENIIQT